jgi:hypothetical protein
MGIYPYRRDNVTKSNLSEITKWAVLSAVFVFVAFAGRIAWSGQDGNTPDFTVAREIDGVKYTFKVSPDAKKRVVQLEVVATPSSSTARTVDVRVESLDRTFTGNPMSRTASPDDYKETQVAKESKVLQLKATGSTTTFKLKYNPFVPSDDPAKRSPTPVLAVYLDGKKASMLPVAGIKLRAASLGLNSVNAGGSASSGKR